MVDAVIDQRRDPEWISDRWNSFNGNYYGRRLSGMGWNDKLVFEPNRKG